MQAVNESPVGPTALPLACGFGLQDLLHEVPILEHAPARDFYCEFTREHLVFNPNTPGELKTSKLSAPFLSNLTVLPPRHCTQPSINTPAPPMRLGLWGPAFPQRPQ